MISNVSCLDDIQTCFVVSEVANKRHTVGTPRGTIMFYGIPYGCFTVPRINRVANKKLQFKGDPSVLGYNCVSRQIGY
jgi:hypothetical protein